MKPHRGARDRSLALLLVVLALSGCGLLRERPPAVQPPAALLAGAEDALVGGDLSAAAAGFRLLAERHPASPQAAEALFQLAALRLAPDSPVHDPEAGLADLRRIETEHPGSAWAPAAAAVLALVRTNDDLERARARLQAQLDEIKRLDLGPDG